MSPFKRQERAAAKAAAGRRRHAKSAPEKLRGGPLPVARAPFVQLLGSPGAFGPQVPVELADPDYEFPRVQLPDSRPVVSAAELLDALDADDEPTEPLALDGLVLDGEPQPARHAGLAPAAAPSIPVPDNPFLNAHPPRHAAPSGSALPARLTDVELTLLGREVPADAPAAPSLQPEPPPYYPIQRDEQHPLVFSSFDAEFWQQVEDTVRRQQAGAGGLRMSNDEAMGALLAHLDRAEAAHQAGIARVAAHEYRGRLADASRTLPRRVPGAALAAIEAQRGELVSA